jgi:hypothetical protein
LVKDQINLPQEETIVRQPSVGEVWMAIGEDGERVCACVLGPIAQMPGFLLVAFADTDYETATDQDFCYAAGEAAPWMLRVSPNLTGAIKPAMLSKRVGVLPDNPVELRRAALGDAASPGLEARRGLPLHGPHDTRLAVRDEQVAALWRAGFYA